MLGANIRNNRRRHENASAHSMAAFSRQWGVKTRLQIFLNDWATKEGVKEGNNIAIQNYLTQQEIANLVCSTRQTVTQLLNDLQNEGKISYTRKKIVLHHKQ